jgi:flagellar motility protein MotE (MotC chaperone)
MKHSGLFKALLAGLTATLLALGLALFWSSPAALPGPTLALAQDKASDKAGDKAGDKAAPAKGDKKAEASAPASAAGGAESADEASRLGGEEGGQASSTQYDPRILALIEQKRAELEQEEDRLARQRQELEKLQLEVNGRIDELKKVQAALEDLVKVEQNQREDRLRSLVKTLTNMKPASASAVIAKLDDQMAVEIFARMSARTAGAVMASLKPEQAARIGEMLTRNKESQKTARIAEEAAASGAQPPPKR